MADIQMVDIIKELFGNIFKFFNDGLLGMAVPFILLLALAYLTKGLLSWVGAIGSAGILLNICHAKGFGTSSFLSSYGNTSPNSYEFNIHNPRAT